MAKKGRYGPYVSHDGVNATLPADKTPETITLEEAVALLDARAERNGPAPHARPRKAKRAVAGARRGPAKRPAAKRPPAAASAKPPAGKTPQENASCRIISTATRHWPRTAADEWPMKRLPSREELVAFIRERSGKVGTREIARAFGAKNADRAALNRMLRELADEGRIDRHRKRLHHAGTLPPVVLADITGRDSDGELLARPTEWDEEAHGAPPVIHIATPRRARPGEVAGVGDRALIRIEETSDEETSGRVIKLIDRAKHRMLGIFRGLPGGGGRLVPIDKKQLGRELAHRAERHGGRGRRRSRRGRSGAAWPARSCRPAPSSSGSARSKASAPSA